MKRRGRIKPADKQRILGTDFTVQAERRARRYDTPTVNVYSVLTDQSLDILEFKPMTEKWLDFIVDCRAEKSQYRQRLN